MVTSTPVTLQESSFHFQCRTMHAMLMEYVILKRYFLYLASISPTSMTIVLSPNKKNKLNNLIIIIIIIIIIINFKLKVLKRPVLVFRVEVAGKQ